MNFLSNYYKCFTEKILKWNRFCSSVDIYIKTEMIAQNQSLTLNPINLNGDDERIGQLLFKKFFLMT